MKLEKLKMIPPNKITGLVSALAFLIFILINQLVFAPLAVNVPVYGILDFEFAWNANQIAQIFAAWGSEGMKLHKAGIYWDFLYILGYGPFIAGLLLLVSRKISRKPQTIGFFLTLAPLLAGVFDVIENILLLVMLGNPGGFHTIIPLIAGIMATIKFGLLLIAILYFFGESILLLVGMLKK